MKDKSDFVISLDRKFLLKCMNYNLILCYAAPAQQVESGTWERVSDRLFRGYVVEAPSDTVWNIIIAGPETTPFEGGQFQIEFKLDNFPFKGPVVSFKTPIYHPNVTNNG